MPDRLRCGAFLAYPPRPTSDVGQTAHDLVLAIKRDAIDPRRGRAYADVVVERLAGLASPELAALFQPPALLMPIPPRTLQRPHSVWAPRTIAQALVRHGFGSDVMTLLERRSPIRKSAGSTTRPTVEEHCASLAVRARLLRPSRVLLIDDVVTRGATLMGAARRLWIAFGPDLEVAAFALAHVRGDRGLQRVADPRAFEITFRDGDVSRRRT